MFRLGLFQRAPHRPFPPLSLMLFITGTDTGVGKTYTTALLISALRDSGVDAIGMKPICCGDRDDAETLAAVSAHSEPVDAINPFWLRAPAAPCVAAKMEKRHLDTTAIVAAFKALAARHDAVLVEGAGGWLVPIRRNYSMADLAAELGLPVIIVAANRLGALNHTLLTVAAIRQSGLPCAGVILNTLTEADHDVAATTNRAVLEEILPVPLLAEISPRASAAPESLTAAVRKILGAPPR